MKKMLSIGILLMSVLLGTAQVDPASITRLYLWERPVTDSLNFPGLPGKVYPVMMFSADGKHAYNALLDSTHYVEIQNSFSNSLFKERSKTTIIGYEYVVQYIPKFSKLTRRDIRKLSGIARVTAKAFNDSDKFTVMAQSPEPVIGERDVSGNKVLKLPIVSPAQPVQVEKKYSWQQ